jgi:chemotaxis signal transduction protein
VGFSASSTRGRGPAAAADAADAAAEHLIFALGGERYGIAARLAREAIRAPRLMPLPGVPDFVAGVIALRGEIVAVFDLGRLLGGPARPATDPGWVLALGGERVEFGVAADEVQEVRTLPAATALLPPEGEAASYLRGITAEALLVLDGEALLRDPKLFIDQGEAAE